MRSALRWLFSIKRRARLDRTEVPDSQAVAVYGGPPPMRAAAWLRLPLGMPDAPLEEGAITTIGRNPDNTVCLTHISVGRRHCGIREERGVYELADLGSPSGTFVNGQSVSRVVLAHGDRIRVGQLELEFVRSDATRAP